MKVKKSMLSALGSGLLMLSLPIAVGAQMMTSSGSVQPFSDVNSSNPNYTAIMYLQNHGVINGYPDGTFKPDQVVNRAEALKMILLGSNVQVATSIDLEPFRDVDRTAWFAPYIQKAKDMNVVSGYPDGTFQPAQTVNLVENLKMLLLTNNVDITNMPTVMVNPYADASKDQWYAKYIEYAKEKNLIDANSMDMVFPAQGMTRGMLAETMYRLMYMQQQGWSSYTQQSGGVSGPTLQLTEQLTEQTTQQTMQPTQQMTQQTTQQATQQSM